MNSIKHDTKIRVKISNNTYWITIKHSSQRVLAGKDISMKKLGDSELN